ncbi:MAG: class I SAM-dependent methyltransferase [Gaiellaceae bacterium]
MKGRELDGAEPGATDITEQVAERFRWAVETMDPAPSDRLLEIGCGHGVAVSLICQGLSSGTIVAIDRSKAMIDRAVRRNRDHVDEGTAAFKAAALKDADFGNERFDKVFAINVRLFRAEAAREADVLQRLLIPKGVLYLFQQHPSANRTRAVTDELRSALERNGLTVRKLTSTGSGASTMTCIVAGPHG